MQRKKTTYCFLTLYEKFISDSRRGKRLQPNGKRLSVGTVENYRYTKKLIEQFCTCKQFVLRILPGQKLTKREREVEKNYWKKFYLRFTDYLYDDLCYFDNYVGATIKNIRTFFNYLEQELSFEVGAFYRQFYVRKEDVAIFPLLPEELNFLIYNKPFEDSLSKRMSEVKDMFVFGCTVALRVSDLLQLKKSALRVVNENYFLVVRSQKTKTDTLIKLPPYAVQIIKRYSSRGVGAGGRLHVSSVKKALTVDCQ
jgi:integrase